MSPEQIKKLRQAGFPLRGGSFNLCELSERQDFFDEVNQAKNFLRRNLESLDYDDIRFTITIGTRTFDVPIQGGTREKVRKTDTGFRVFRGLRTLERFLGLRSSWSYWKEEGELRERKRPDWSKSGMCNYDKSAKIVIPKFRGKRIVGEQTLRTYEFE